MSGDINVQSFSGKVNINNNLLVGSSHLFVDTVNNRVGITTASPDAGLHVNSNAYVHTDFRVGSGIVMNDTNGRITAGSFVGDGSAMTGINSDSGSWVNGTNSNVHLATSTDKVGIGTTSPQQKLDLGDLGGGSIRLGRDHDDDNTSTNRIGRTGVGSDIWYSSVNFIDEDTNDDAISFVTHRSGVGPFERMRISGNGNVGIGTTNPGEKLTVNGNLDFTPVYGNQGDSNKSGMIIFNKPIGESIDTSTNIDAIYYDDATNRYHFTQDTTKYAEGNAGIVCGDLTLTTGSIKLIDSSTPDGRFIGYYEDDGTTQIGFMGQGSSSNKDLYMWGRADSAVRIAAGNVERIRVEAGGDVGIGTDSPDAKLHVNGNTIIGDVGGYATNGYTDAQLTLGGTHNTGYNNNDQVKLLISGGNNDGGSPYYIMCEDENGHDQFYVKGGTSSDGTGGTVYIKNSVGIGTTSPGYKLDVSGNLRVTTGILDTSWCSGSWLQTCTQSPTVTVYSNNGGGPMSTPGHGGSGMGGNRGRFTAKKEGNYLISCCAIHMGRGTTTSSGTNLLVVFDAVGTNWNLNNVIDTYDEIIDLRTAPTAEEAYTFACQVYMNVGHYFSFRVHSSGYIDNNAKLLCSAALVR